MKSTIKYFSSLKEALDKIVVTNKAGVVYRFDEAVKVSIDLITNSPRAFLIGNGASASIASHIAADLEKNADIRALSFNDSSLLTCISNDCGYEHVFEKPIKLFADKNDLLIAISSSGKSENILRGVSAAKKRSARIITLSGFNVRNPLRKTGDVNFYVPSASYGYVETIHTAICHCLVDMIVEKKNG